MTFLRVVISLYLFVAHDLFGKPVPTFPDHALARHHDPTRWLTDDSFGRATPYHFVEAGVAIAAHDQKSERVLLHIRLEHLSDRTAVDLDGFEYSLDPVLGQMLDQGRPGRHLFRGFLVGCRDDAHGLR